MTKLVFMGSPQFAVPALAALANEYDIVAVFTQPDKPAGRGKVLTSVPVKAWAQAHGLPVYQPRSFRKEPEAVATLRALNPDLIVVAAYGLILPQSVLDIPARGCINIHGSLLPRHRGAAPITAAILAGDAETGITIMLMDAGMDTGPILSMANEPLHPDDTTASLSERLSQLGARLLMATLPKYLNGEIVPQPQPQDGATYSPKINKTDAQLDWTLPAREIDRRVRAYVPWPVAYTGWNGQMVKVWKVRVRNGGSEFGGQGAGTVVQPADGAVCVITGAGLIVLEEIQLAGRKVMPARDFVRGQPGFIHSELTLLDVRS